MKKDKIIQARVPSELHDAIERERKRKKVKASALIRSILELHLKPKRRAA